MSAVSRKYKDRWWSGMFSNFAKTAERPRAQPGVVGFANSCSNAGEGDLWVLWLNGKASRVCLCLLRIPTSMRSVSQCTCWIYEFLDWNSKVLVNIRYKIEKSLRRLYNLPKSLKEPYQGVAIGVPLGLPGLRIPITSAPFFNTRNLQFVKTAIESGGWNSFFSRA